MPTFSSKSQAISLMTCSPLLPLKLSFANEVMSACFLQPEPPGPGPAGVALLCGTSVPRVPPGLLQQREQTNGVSYNGGSFFFSI